MAKRTVLWSMFYNDLPPVHPFTGSYLPCILSQVASHVNNIAFCWSAGLCRWSLRTTSMLQLHTRNRLTALIWTQLWQLFPPLPGPGGGYRKLHVYMASITGSIRGCSQHLQRLAVWSGCPSYLCCHCVAPCCASSRSRGIYGLQLLVRQAGQGGCTGPVSMYA